VAASLRSDGRRLANGTAATIVSVSRSGLTVRADRQEQAALLPTSFVEGRRLDGRPQLSHAWCRTIDGVQGGTWAEVHLLGTVAVDRYRGYVGQSRATVGTHTWNTRPVDPGDHGGRLVHGADRPAQEVLAAMQGNSAKTFAAFDDPYRLAGRLERERDGHRAVLAGRPPDVTSQLNAAQRAMAAATEDLRQAEARVANSQREVEATGGLGRWLPTGRRNHGEAERTLRSNEQGVDYCDDRVDQRSHQLASLESRDRASRDFDQAHGWRHKRIAELDERLDRHWADVVVAAARAGDPYAYGRHRIERAYYTLLDHTGATSRDEGVDRNLADLEQAVLTSRSPMTAGPTPVQDRPTTVRRRPEWLQPGPDRYRDRDRGRGPDIGR
jgi:hypothetical protein